MGNGISRTYPAGILKNTPKTVRFGNHEVRVMQQDGWETKPLLNTHEVRRIEAKIRAAEMRPMQKPQIQQLKPLPEKRMSKRTMTVIFSVTCATAILCGLLGPFGLILPAVVIGLWLIGKAVEHKPNITSEQKIAATKAVLHLQKLAYKHERAGLDEQAKVYKNMVIYYRKMYRI